MYRIFFLVTFLFFFSHFSFSQELRQRLGRSFVNPDSADIIFELEKANLKNAGDSGIYYYFYAEQSNRRLNENDRAKELFLKSSSLLDPERSSDLISLCYIRLNRLESMAGNWDQSLFYSQKGLDNATAAKDTSYMGYALLDISVVYHDMEDYEKGVDYGKQAYNLLRQFSEGNPTFEAFALNAIGISFDDWEMPDSALFYHYKIIENIDQLDSSRITFTFNNIGNTLLKQEKFSEAQSWIETAVGLNNQDEDAYSLAANYTNLATIAYNLKDFGRAYTMMDSAAKYVDMSQSTEKKRDYLYEQYRFHKAMSQPVKAMTYLEEYAVLKDSIFKEERVELMGELEAKYEVQTKERELAESRVTVAENEVLIGNRNNQLLLLLVLILVVLSVGFFIYYRQMTRNRHLEQESKLQAILAEQETQNRLLEQRNRISSDLHDNIGAQLTFIVSSLDNLKYVELSKTKLANKVDQISAFTVETVNELRDTIWALNKESISLEDLQLRLSNLIQKAQTSCPVLEFHLEIAKDLSIDKKLNSMEGINYYRVAQEAINNAVKHSGATQISVWLGIEDGVVSLKVRDNGKGIPKDNVIGNGLGTMRNRAERIGRSLVLNSSAQSGTEVCIL